MNQAVIFLFLAVLFHSCDPRSQSEKSSPTDQSIKSGAFQIPGEDVDMDLEKVKKGKVLIAYNDCYQCHRMDNPAKGPSFSAIAKRYPIQKQYIELLGRKIISGGSGTWGYPVMGAHPKLSEEEAQAMVWYILSLESYIMNNR